METLAIAMLKARACEKPPTDRQAIEIKRQQARIFELESEVAALKNEIARLHMMPALSVPPPMMLARPMPSVQGIKELICATYDLNMVEMVSELHTRRVTWPRQIAMYLCTRLTAFTLPVIGRHFGDRDHTTVMHARNKIASDRAAEPALDEKLKVLEAQFAIPTPETG